MDLNFTLSKNALLKFYKTYLPKTKYYTYYKAIVLIVLLSVWIIQCFLFSDIHMSALIIIVHLILIFLFWTIFCNIVALNLSTWKLKLDLSSDSSKYILETQKIYLNDMYIECTNSLSKNTLPLENLINLCTLNDFILLIFKNHSLLIPYTAFKDKLEEQKFIEHITDNTHIQAQTTISKDFNFLKQFL